MDILLIRHLESEKNINNRFSTPENKEHLTDGAKQEGTELAKSIKKFIFNHKLNVDSIYCADSARAVETAEIMATSLSIKVVAFEDLLSTKTGILQGKNEDEAKDICPKYIEELELFRAGIFSAYNFTKVPNKEDKYVFETRVTNRIENIMCNETKEDVKIIVLHHSSLTAAVIYFARKCLNYPMDYYGLVVANYGGIYWIHSEDGIFEFKKANCKAYELE